MRNKRNSRGKVCVGLRDQNFTEIAFRRLEVGLSKAQKFQELRLGWPATEWETGPEPKMAGEMAGSHFLGGFQNGRKMAGQMAGQLKFGDFLHVRPFARPFLGHFWTPTKKMAAGHFSAFPFCSRPAESQFKNLFTFMVFSLRA